MYVERPSLFNQLRDSWGKSLLREKTRVLGRVVRVAGRCQGKKSECDTQTAGENGGKRKIDPKTGSH